MAGALARAGEGRRRWRGAAALVGGGALCWGQEQDGWGCREGAKKVPRWLGWLGCPEGPQQAHQPGLSWCGKARRSRSVPWVEAKGQGLRSVPWFYTACGGVWRPCEEPGRQRQVGCMAHMERAALLVVRAGACAWLPIWRPSPGLHLKGASALPGGVCAAWHERHACIACRQAWQTC